MKIDSNSRRDFLKTSLTLAAAGAASPLLAKENDARQPNGDLSNRRAFPADFGWGTATAAYQVEGAAEVDGRKPSIWDTFCKTPGHVIDGSSGAIACDHYHRFKDDVKLMADLGAKRYRFSISWARVLPDGRGAVNEKGLDFYKRLADCLGEHGIIPHATLYHWDCPQVLEDEYGSWRSRKIVDDFATYASVVGKGLGDRVKDWMTLNEIATFTIFCGYGVGYNGPHAPGGKLTRRKEQTTITHHALLAHGRACQALRAASPGPCRVAIAEVPMASVPVLETPEHIEAARKAFRQTEPNAGILVPLLTGQYDPVWLERLGAEAPEIREGDMALIAQPLDALGVNCYTGKWARAADNRDGFEEPAILDSYPKHGLNWLHHLPEALYWLVRQTSELSGKPDLPIFITENGRPDGEPHTGAGEYVDIERIVYLRGYLGQLSRAIAEGYPVQGYFAWSLLDNFEWAEGYTKRFGLVSVDYATQRRTPKLSYRWMQEVIRTGRLV